MRLSEITRLFCGATVLLALMVVVTGCNTVEGVGKDVKATGEAIEDAADDDD